MGWSLGGAMSWFAPYMSNRFSNLVVIGSCALYRDIIMSSKQHHHGLYYYPSFRDHCFDLDEVALDLNNNAVNLTVVFGARDKSCIMQSLITIVDKIEKYGDPGKFQFKIDKRADHNFSLVKEFLIHKDFDI